MSDHFERLEQKTYDSHYLYVDTTIDHSVGAIWPYALDIGSWMTAHRFESLAGEAGKAGHFVRVLPRGLGNEVPLPHHHLYGIAEIIPQKLIVLEVFPEKGGSYGNERPWVSFDSILFSDLGNTTKVIFLMIDVHLRKGDEEYLQRRKKEIDGARSLLNGYFNNLRMLVENGDRTSARGSS
jgi:hypothetical protein